MLVKQIFVVASFNLYLEAALDMPVKINEMRIDIIQKRAGWLQAESDSSPRKRAPRIFALDAFARLALDVKPTSACRPPILKGVLKEVRQRPYPGIRAQRHCSFALAEVQ